MWLKQVPYMVTLALLGVIDEIKARINPDHNQMSKKIKKDKGNVNVFKCI